MRFPPRCYYCRRVIRWPLGLVVFWGTKRAFYWGRRRLHVAHHTCLVATEWSRGQADAFPGDDGFTNHHQ
jgi:hypothetical protein